MQHKKKILMKLLDISSLYYLFDYKLFKFYYSLLIKLNIKIYKLSDFSITNGGKKGFGVGY